MEIFFARDPHLERYYSIEIDPLGRVLDYAGRFYRRFDDAWDTPGLETAGRQRPDGYYVEARITPAALESMGLEPTDPGGILAGVYRGEFSTREGRAPNESWISWVRPRVKEPDFHVPSSFGCLRLRPN